MKNILNFISESVKSENTLNILLGCINALSDEYKNKIDANLIAELILALGKFSKITKEDMIDAFDFYFPADAFGGQEEQNKLALEIIKRHKKSILEFATEFLNEINK